MLVFNGIQQKFNENFWKSIIQLLNLDNLGAPIKFEGVESISTLENLIEKLENLDSLKETLLDFDQIWLQSLFHLTFRLHI